MSAGAAAGLICASASRAVSSGARDAESGCSRWKDSRMSPRGADLAGCSASPQLIRKGTRPPADRAQRQPPPQHRARWRGPLHAGHLARVVAATAGPGHRRVDVMAGNRRTSQPTTADAVGAKRARRRRLGLPGIGSDDLQIGLRAESEQRVVGAMAGVLATSLGPNTQTLLHLSNCIGQVWSPVDEMVDQLTRSSSAPAAADPDVRLQQRLRIIMHLI